MTEFIQMDWFALILVGVGTMLLLGEILVNMRGIFAILGILSIALYFYFYLTDFTTFIIMFIIYLAGLLLVIIDGKLISDGTLALLGIVAMLISVALTAPSFTAGLYAVIGLIIGVALSFLFLKFLPKRNMWSKIALRDRLTKEAGYSSLSEEYAQLVGKKGITKTDLRPVGTVLIEGKEYSVVSNAEWIHRGTGVEVTEVDGTKILVKKINE